jgi:hypothetical protein
VLGLSAPPLDEAARIPGAQHVIIVARTRQSDGTPTAPRAERGRRGIVEHMSLANDMSIIEAQRDRLRLIGNAARPSPSA